MKVHPGNFQRPSKPLSGVLGTVSPEFTLLPIVVGDADPAQIAAVLEKALAKRREDRFPTARFNAEVSPHRVFGTAYTTLDVLKEIRTALPEATINDVGVAVVGGAIRRYLLDKGELPDEAMVAMMPISIRPTTTRASGAVSSSTSRSRGSIGASGMSVR